jgi:hypothetical protein
MRLAKHHMKWSALVALSFISACASGPTQEQLASADYGRDIPPAECVSVAERVIADSLKDPGSAQFRHAQCFKGHWGSAPIFGMGVAFGWIQQGEVNAKNSYGGYVGFKAYQVLIKNGTAIRYCINNKDGICVPSGS